MNVVVKEKRGRFFHDLAFAIVMLVFGICAAAGPIGWVSFIFGLGTGMQILATIDSFTAWRCTAIEEGAWSG